jgi:hypothetical protein
VSRPNGREKNNISFVSFVATLRAWNGLLRKGHEFMAVPESAPVSFISPVLDERGRRLRSAEITGCFRSARCAGEMTIADMATVGDVTSSPKTTPRAVQRLSLPNIPHHSIIPPLRRGNDGNISCLSCLSWRLFLHGDSSLKRREALTLSIEPLCIKK